MLFMYICIISICKYREQWHPRSPENQLTDFDFSMEQAMLAMAMILNWKMELTVETVYIYIWNLSSKNALLESRGLL